MQWDDINRRTTKEEVKEALMSMSPVKALGPDGLYALFYQKTQSIVGDQVYSLVDGFLQTGTLPMGFNDTNLVLIPKTQTLEKTSQFRPINLCNVAYKIVTKVKTSRLKKIMPDLISLVQRCFMLERQITDNIVIYQEVLHTGHALSKGRLGPCLGPMLVGGPYVYIILYMDIYF